MSRKIFRPEGRELTDYINEGYPICRICGAVMDLAILSAIDYRYLCPGCGFEIDTDDYEPPETEGCDPRMEELIGRIED